MRAVIHQSCMANKALFPDQLLCMEGWQMGVEDAELFELAKRVREIRGGLPLPPVVANGLHDRKSKEELEHEARHNAGVSTANGVAYISRT